MALDEVSLGLALLFELTRSLKSIQERNACYKEGLVLCENLDVTLTRLKGLVENIDKILRSSPGTMPHAVLPDFVSTLKTAKESLLQADNEMAEYSSRTFSESNRSGFLQKFAERGRRLIRARSLYASLGSTQRNAAETERQLQHLLTQLCTALKVDEAALKSHQDLRSLIEEHFSPQERFFPAFNAPMLPGNIHLDFEAKDADGKFSAPEGSLKSVVFMSTSPTHLIVARGASRPSSRRIPVHGVSGMAGVGKTMSLIGLGHEEDIKAHFFHGVLYMTIGANASAGHIITELWKIMSVTGATTRAEAVRSSKTLPEAIAIANLWFHGKRILFLIDDIWPTAACAEGYLPDLETLLQGSPHSRMAISTRSLEIASKEGSYVDFGARDPYGPTSLAIFLAHALPSSQPSDSLLQAARQVLHLCAGLPISLSVAGSAVALRVNTGDEFKEACQTYVENIQAQILLHPGVSFLNNAIRLSLSALAEDREKNGRGLNETSTYSLVELYVSLCVLENQQFAPISVLARMWNLSYASADNVCVAFTSMSLAKISTRMFDGRKQRGVTIHDLHLDFCRESEGRRGERHIWHRRLLDNHLAFNQSASETNIDSLSDLRGFNILEYKPRQWWKNDIPNKKYIRENLSRHLRSAGLELELGATMLDVRWVAAQGASGGILQVKNDLDILRETVQEKGVFEGTDEPLMPVTTISNSFSGMGVDLQLGIRPIGHSLFSLLTGLSKTNEWFYRYLEQVKEVTPPPFLVPTVALFRLPVDDLKMDVQLKLPDPKYTAYLSTDFSSNSKYCAAGANHDVAVFDLESRTRLKWLKGHEKNVSVVKFNSDASKVISGSLDKCVIVWDWKEIESPLLILKGHEQAVTSLSFTANDEEIFSGSRDGTVRVWNALTGHAINKIAYGAEVECVSSCPSNKLIAVGTIDGFLRCSNSISGECVFELTAGSTAAISVVQFGPDGKVLISGDSLGNATRHYVSDWEKSSTVSVPGSVTHVSFHPDGADALIGSSKGDVHHWLMSQPGLSKYNVSMARPVSGLAFFKDGWEMIVSVKYGYGRAWSSPRSNPDLDLTEIRDNILFDFDLSADGTRVATSSQDEMIRIWKTDTGIEIAAYPTPNDGSHRLALSATGTKIASSSSKGTIRVWNTDIPPSDTDISFRAGEDCPSCLSFSRDGGRLLVCLEHEVSIWSMKKETQKLGQIFNLGCPNASFSADGRLIIVGDPKQTCIWDAKKLEKVFDSSEPIPRAMTLSEAREATRTCGPSAHRVWPSSWKSTEDVFVPSPRDAGLTLENIFCFVNSQVRPANIQFSHDTYVRNNGGLLSIFKLQK